MTGVTVKKQKAQKRVMRRKLNIGNFKNCLEVTQLENELNYLEKK